MKLKDINFEFTELESPLKSLTQEEIDTFISEFGKTAGSNYSKSLEELNKKVLEFEPTILLSYLSYYGLSAPLGVDREITDENPVHQHYVEILQAVILKNDYSTFSINDFNFKYFEDIYNLLKNTTTNFHLRRITDVKNVKTEQEKSRVEIIENLRVITQAVRNWGYPDQIFKMSYGLFAPLENSIKDKLGINFHFLLDLFKNIFKEIEHRLNHHRNKLNPIYKEQTITGVVNTYHKNFTHIESSAKEFITYANSQKWSIDDVKNSLTLHSFMSLPIIYTFNLKDLIRLYPSNVEEKDIENIFNRISLKFGELSEYNTEHFFLNNPIWEKPFIKLNDKIFFIPVAGLLLSFNINILENILKSEDDILSKYEICRGNYLEDELEKLFKSYFKSAKIFRGSKWFDLVSNKEYENDLLIHLDSFLIVVEAKSGKLTDPARRGGTGRIEKKIEELIIEPSSQANRFAQYLLDNKKVHIFNTKKGIKNTVDSRKIHHVIRLNITLENLSALSMRIPALIKAGLIDNSIDFIPSISLNDLEVIFKLLNSEIERIHYLLRRTEFEINANYFGDELDLLAFYIETGFNIGDKEFDGTRLVLSPISKTLDPYFLQQWQNEKVDKPKRKYHKWWIDILKKVEERAIERWSEIGITLLNCSYDDQLDFINLFEKQKKKISVKPGMEPTDEAVILFNGPEKRRDVIIGFPYKRISTEKRNNWLFNIADQAMLKADVTRALILGVNTDSNHYPYSIAAVLELDDESK